MVRCGVVDALVDLNKVILQLRRGPAAAIVVHYDRR